MYRKFTLSCSMFGGYSKLVDITRHESSDEICKYVVKELYNTLGIYNLYQLRNILVLRKYHIHNETMKDIKNVEKEYYICNCGEC